MPSTVNGIGTWYYGKDNVFSYADFCSHCNRYVTLSSYDTREWIVVLFVPVIPLRRKRIFDSCPACTNHRHMPLKKYLKAKEDDYLEADQKFQDNPNDPQALGHLLQIFAAYQDLELFDQVVPQVHQRFPGESKLFNIVGMINYQFGRMQQARDSFEQSLSIQDDDEIRHMLGFVYTRLDEPDTAAENFQYIIDKKLQDKANALFALVEAYQAQGRHQEAIVYLDHMVNIKPQFQKDKAYKKARKLSEKHQDSGKAIRNKQIISARKQKTPLSGKTAWAIVGVVVLAALLIFFGNAFLRGHQASVYLVNGLDRPYEVVVNGKEYALSKNSYRKISLQEGDVSVEVADESLGIEPAALQLKSSFWTRPFNDRIYMINPDTIALIEWNKVYYHENVNKAPEPEWKIYYGQSLYVFDDIDFPFKQFPDEITMSNSYGAEPRTQITLFDQSQMSAEQMPYMIEDLFGYESKVDYMKKVLQYEPENQQLLHNLYDQTDVETFIETVRPGLDRIPVRVEWHRLYQVAMDRTYPDYDLAAEYKKRLDQMPGDASLQYLYGRSLRNDPTQAQHWYEQSIQNANCCSYGYYALGYGALGTADFKTAVDYFRQAEKNDPDNPGFCLCYFEALLATDQLDTAREYAKRQMLKDPGDAGWIQEYTSVLRQQQKHDLARQEFERWSRQNKNNFSVADFNLLKKYERIDAAYLNGDFKAISTIIGEPNDIYEKTLLTLNSKKSISNDMIAEADSYPTMWLLLFYISEAQLGNESDAKLFLTEAMKRFQRGSFEERYLAACLESESEIDPETVCCLPMEVSMKAVTLTAFGIRFAQYRERFFEMAGQLNFKKVFPYHFLHSVHQNKDIQQSRRPANAESKQI